MAYITAPTEAGLNATPRQRLLARKNALWTERSSWETHWQELSQYQLPRLGRFMRTDRNQGGKKHQNILDNTAVFAHRTLAAGMMSGMTSPARPWFRLTLPDKDLMESGAVKQWLHKVTKLLLAVFGASNTYRSLHSCYEELGLFGTWASIVLPDFDNVLHHYPLTCGEYALATDYKGNVNTLAREFQMTVAQMVEQFGKENCSTTVRNLFDTGNLDAWVDVIHIIEPRKERDVAKRDAKNMKWKSCYIEPSSDNYERYLRESGFEMFPVLAPRWVVTGNDIYGQSPGMDCQGDVRQLQHQQLRKGQAIDYQTNPPIQVPTAYRDQARNRLPGGVMFVDATGPGGGVRSAYEVNINLQHLREDILDVRMRIDAAYYKDLFLMLANDTRSGITATEVAERHEEKLLMLGPVLERLDNELLSPKIDLAFEYCRRAGILPVPPEELKEGLQIDVELVSVLAQAQRMVAAGGVDRLLTTLGGMAGMKPEVLDKVDFDQVVDDYGEMFGVNPAIIVPDDTVAQIRETRSRQMLAQQTAASIGPAVDAAKVASEIDVDNTAAVMQSLQGYGTPPAAA